MARLSRHYSLAVKCMLLGFIFLIGICMQVPVCADDEFGHTFYSMRPVYELVSPLKRSLFHTTRLSGVAVDEAYNQDTPDSSFVTHCIGCSRSGGSSAAPCALASIQAVFFGGATSDPQELNQYFMMYPRQALNVLEYKEPNFTQNPSYQEIEARNFNIVTSAQYPNEQFNSVIQFRPSFTTWGIGFTWLQTIQKRECGAPLWWLEWSLPLQQVNQTMNMKETIISAGGGAADSIGLENSPHVGSMAQAFKQDHWNFSRIEGPNFLHAFGVADMELTLGYNAVRGSRSHIDVYGGLKIPTGTKVNQHAARFLFPPIIGNNHHWGIELGSHLGYTIFHHIDHFVQLQFDYLMMVLLPNTQWRSFDLLHQGNWSRFLEVYRNDFQAVQAAGQPTPLRMDSGSFGINSFTQPARIFPGLVINTNTAFVYTHHGFSLEGGYNVYVRQTEQVQLSHWHQDVSVKNITGGGTTNWARTIGKDVTQEALPVSGYRAITKNDINVRSAAHPALISSMLYLATAYTTLSKIPLLFGLGGIYEFSYNNSAVRRWFVYAKLGISF